MSGLHEVARVASEALEADGLVVVGPGRDVVAAAGARAHDLATDLGGGLDDLPAAPWTCGSCLVRSLPLPDSAGRPVGIVHVGWSRADGESAASGAGAGRRREDVLRAFAAHLGLALARRGDHRSEAAPAPTEDEWLLWGDPGRLPAIQEITGQITEVMRPVTGARAVGITVWDPERRILRALPGAFGSDDDTLAASVTGPVTNMLSAGSRVFASGAPYVSNEAGADPGVLQPYAEVFRIGRLLSVPLERRSHRIGVLHLANKPTDFTTEDIAAVEALVPRLAAAVELAGTVERMAAQQRLEGILTDAAVAVASGKAVRESLEPAFDRLADEVGASIVALVPPGSGALIRRTGAPTPDELERRLLADARDLVATSSGAFPRGVGDPGWAALHAPVELDGERAATIALLRRTGQPFTSQEEDVVGRLASLVALAWTTERYQRQLAEITRLRERERIGDGLHDRIAQIFFAAGLGIDSVIENRARGPEEQRLVEVRDLLVHGDAIVREVIHRLDADATPASGLARRLRRAIESVEDEFGVAVHAEIPLEDELAAVPRPVADAAAKVAREGTLNAAKHAGPCRIGLQVSTSAAELVVDDGFVAPTRADAALGHGLTSLRRAVQDVGGTLAVDTSAERLGARVRATFPL